MHVDRITKGTMHTERITRFVDAFESAARRAGGEGAAEVRGPRRKTEQLRSVDTLGGAVRR
jgi:hypothetical protein